MKIKLCYAVVCDIADMDYTKKILEEHGCKNKRNAILEKTLRYYEIFDTRAEAEYWCKFFGNSNWVEKYVLREE